MRRLVLRIAFMFLAVAPLLQLAAPAQATPVHPYPTVTLNGLKTTWQMTVLQIHRLDRFPGIAWKSYSIREFFALTIRLRNIGTQPADLAEDLTLVLKVMPPHFTYYTPGWTMVGPTPPLPAMEKAATRMFGGVLPWTVTRPGATTTYSYLITTNRGDSYYGLYQFDPVKGTYTLLFPTGY